jgi:hypothetical protein
MDFVLVWWRDTGIGYTYFSMHLLPDHLFCFHYYDGVKLCLCGTAAANGPFVHPPDDTWVNMEQGWNDIDSGKPKDSEKTLSQCHLSTAKPTWTALGENPGLRGKKPAAIRLSYSTTNQLTY